MVELYILRCFFAGVRLKFLRLAWRVSALAVELHIAGAELHIDGAISVNRKTYQVHLYSTYFHTYDVCVTHSDS